MSGRKGSRDYNFLISRQTTMGAQISKKDQDYKEYSGADYHTALMMGKINFILRTKLFQEKLTPKTRLLLKEAYRYLDQKRKAYFCSIGSDIFTKLAFLVPDTAKVASFE